MKYTIEGFSQKKLVELGLDANDALILRWYVDFYNTGKMAIVTENGKSYLWVKYQAVIDDLPILGINNKNNIARRFQKMVDSGLMEKYLKKEDGGTFTCFRLVESVYTSLVDEIVKSAPTLLKSRTGLYSKVEPKDYSINRYNNSKFSPEENKETTSVEEKTEVTEVKETLKQTSTELKNRFNNSNYLQSKYGEVSIKRINTFINSLGNSSVKEIKNFLSVCKRNKVIPNQILKNLHGFIISGIDFQDFVDKKTDVFVPYSFDIFSKNEIMFNNLVNYSEE